MQTELTSTRIFYGPTFDFFNPTSVQISDTLSCLTSWGRIYLFPLSFFDPNRAIDGNPIRLIELLVVNQPLPVVFFDLNKVKNDNAITLTCPLEVVLPLPIVFFDLNKVKNDNTITLICPLEVDPPLPIVFF